MEDGIEGLDDWLVFTKFLETSVADGLISLGTSLLASNVIIEICETLGRTEELLFQVPGVGTGPDKQALLVWDNGAQYLEIEVRSDGLLTLYYRDRAAGTAKCLCFKGAEAMALECRQLFVDNFLD